MKEPVQIPRELFNLAASALLCGAIAWATWTTVTLNTLKTEIATLSTTLKVKGLASR